MFKGVPENWRLFYGQGNTTNPQDGSKPVGFSKTTGSKSENFKKDGL
ncbi:hypothetical protein [Flavobacterium nackdongense]|nr:hypothetical protein [Flavobacterium nackdongense]